MVHTLICNLFRLLLSYGAEINEDKKGCTPLFYASSSGSSTNLTTLLDTGLVDVNQKASNGKTAMSKARCYKTVMILTR